uniref:Uncharacterized protein n=1 Tax=Anguilla anguilla TaxID=7936 RepID=A0A0E9T5N4_ANGAN
MEKFDFYFDFKLDFFSFYYIHTYCCENHLDIREYAGDNVAFQSFKKWDHFVVVC